MKIFVKFYAARNLGDDLFLKMLIDRYKNIDFYTFSSRQEDYEDCMEQYKNLAFTDKRLEELDEEMNRYDAYIYIGGSIFMESEQSIEANKKQLEILDKCKKINKPFFYIGSNFGPYKTEEYFELIKNVLSKSTDACFRDQYSYNLFKELENVRYAPDVIFGYDIPKIEKIKDTVGISVIKPSLRKSLTGYDDKYYSFLVKNIVNCIDCGNEVHLFSFCDVAEEDEEAILEITNRLPEGYKDRVNSHLYNGSIEEFVSNYGRMEYMVCTRFHSMILSNILRQKAYILSYSDKIDNVIKDLDLTDKFVDIRNIQDDTILDINDFSVMNYHNGELAKNSSKHFSEVDRFIEIIYNKDMEK